MATRKNQATKQQLQDMLTSLVKKARDTGEYDNLCEEGKEVIHEAEKLLGLDVPYEDDINITVRVPGGFVVGGDGDALDSSNYTVIVKNGNGKQLLNAFIYDVDDVF